MELVTFVLFGLFWHEGTGTQCSSTIKVFSYSQKARDMALQGSALLELAVSDFVECSMACLQRADCLSYDYREDEPPPWSERRGKGAWKKKEKKKKKVKKVKKGGGSKEDDDDDEDAVTFHGEEGRPNVCRLMSSRCENVNDCPDLKPEPGFNFYQEDSDSCATVSVPLLRQNY